MTQTLDAMLDALLHTMPPDLKRDTHHVIQRRTRSCIILTKCFISVSFRVQFRHLWDPFCVLLGIVLGHFWGDLFLPHQEKEVYFRTPWWTLLPSLLGPLWDPKGWALSTFLCPLYSVVHTLYSLLSALYSKFESRCPTLFTLNSELWGLYYSTLSALYSRIVTLYSLLHTPYAILYTVRSTLYTLDAEL